MYRLSLNAISRRRRAPYWIVKSLFDAARDDVRVGVLQLLLLYEGHSRIDGCDRLGVALQSTRRWREEGHAQKETRRRSDAKSEEGGEREW